MTQRIKRRRQELLATPPELCPERAVLVTRAYERYANQPAELLRAHALREILETMTIRIYDGELLVGNQASKLRAAPIFPEYSADWILQEMDSFARRTSSKWQVSEETKEILRGVLPKWENRTLKDKVLAVLPDDARRCNEELVYILTGMSCAVGHIVVDYERLLTRGIDGVKADAQRALERLDYADPRVVEKQCFYESIVIVCDAVVGYARRFSALAAEMAEGETDPTRRDELRAISAICHNVPAKPAQTFHEALQSFWFLQVAIQIESNGHSISPGRFDQYMYPFYRQDIDDGRLSVDQGQELLQSLWIKFNEVNKLRDWTGSRAFGGNPMFQNLLIGGVDRQGRDATNPLSYQCVAASMAVKLPQPSLSMRYHNGTPDRLLNACCELSKMGQGMPAFFNDEVIVPIMLDLGASLEEARDYAEVGCVETQIPGKTEGFYTGGFLNICKVLEIMLHDGVNPLTGSKLAPKAQWDTATFEEFYRNFVEQMRHFMLLQGAADNIIDLLHGQFLPTPLISCFVDNCMETGLDVRRGGAKYNYISPNLVGLANMGDSLAVIKQLVFEEKALTMGQLRQAIMDDFEGHEELRQRILNDVPKYGNDEDAVDSLVHRIAGDFCDIMRSMQNDRGGCFLPGLQSISAHTLFAGSIGATPDGRKTAQLMADGGVSAAQGRDRNGPTALLNSVSKIDQYKAPTGALLNVKFNPATIAGDGGTRNMASLIKTYFANKGQHIQFNVVGADTLRKAQREPEQYSDLIVRIAGFSVFFTDIDSLLQNDVIERMEQQVVS